MKPTDVHPEQKTLVSKDPEVLPLPVMVIAYEDGTSSLVSAWKPSLKERLSILLKGKVYLLVLADKQPPVLLLANKSDVGLPED